MKASLTLLMASLCLFMTSCGAKKHYTDGNYDLAIRKAVTKLRKKPNHMKTMVVLEDAFSAAQTKDMGAINYLKKEGNPANWDNIYVNYSTIKKREDLVKSLRNIPKGITLIGVEDEMLAAKQKAADYHYAKAEQLLSLKNRQDARSAHAHLQKVRSYYHNYKDVQQKLKEALDMGTSYVLLSMKNKSGMIMPAGFEKAVLAINLNNLNDGWTLFHAKEQEGQAYHYHAIFDLNQMVISPEQVKQTSYFDSKEIQDGWEYELDENGNVLKDTNGNDIKVKKFKTISCKIIQTAQLKSARVSGYLTIYNLENQQLIKQDPIASDVIFEHFSARYLGDKRALTKESRRLIRNRVVPFPSNEALILNGTDRLKGIIKDILYRHQRIFV